MWEPNYFNIMSSHYDTDCSVRCCIHRTSITHVRTHYTKRNRRTKQTEERDTDTNTNTDMNTITTSIPTQTPTLIPTRTPTRTPNHRHEHDTVSYRLMLLYCEPQRREFPALACNYTLGITLVLSKVVPLASDHGFNGHGCDAVHVSLKNMQPTHTVRVQVPTRTRTWTRTPSLLVVVS